MKVAGIRFRKAGKIYYFDPNGLEMSAGEHVIVETVRGVEYGVIVLADKEVEDDQVVQPLKKVLRLANDDDKAAEIRNKEKEREAFAVCKSKIIKHGLDMKLIDCEYTFDNNKLLFYFTADGRVDFRELVKDLASVFKTRIELRQIGVRDETKMLGSIGICGRTLCCHAHLSDFHPVSIKMAKDQNLSLNPTKISGVCGRLMCCLKYEESTYKELNRNLPRHGSKVRLRYSGEVAEVLNTNIIRQLVKVVVRKEDSAPEIMEVKLEDLELQRDGKFQKRSPVKKQDRAENDKDGRKQDKSSKEGDGSDKPRQKAQRSNRSRSNNKNKQQSTGSRNKGGGKQQNSGKKTSDKKSGDKSNRDNKKGSTGSKAKNNNQANKKSEGNKNTGNRSKSRRPRNRNNKPKTDGGSNKNQNKE